MVLEAVDINLAIVEHLSGTLNYEADALSRVAQGKSLPPSLALAEERKPPARSDEFWKACHKQWKPFLRALFPDRCVNVFSDLFS